MKQRNVAVALLTLLCISRFQGFCHAVGNSTAPTPAKAMQIDEDGYGDDVEGPEVVPEETEASYAQEGSRCPDPQPADSVKDGK